MPPYFTPFDKQKGVKKMLPHLICILWREYHTINNLTINNSVLRLINFLNSNHWSSLSKALLASKNVTNTVVYRFLYNSMYFLKVYIHNSVACVFSSFFFFRKNYLLLSYATSVRPSVRPSVCPSVCPSVRPSVRPSVEIISFRGNSLPNRPIELKIGLNVCEGVVHVRKAWFFEILIASCKFMQFAIFCK